MKNNQFFSMESIEKSTKSPPTRLFYPFYIGIDIGADFHVASCISPEMFRDGKWKRTKVMKFNADSKGITDFLTTLRDIQIKMGLQANDFFMLLEPTGGHYSYLLTRILLDEGYELYQVENKAVKEFRDRTLGIAEKSDAIDARVMAYMGWHKSLHPDLKSVKLVRPASVSQSVFRTLTRDRWLLTTQLTRRKNQIQQLYAITHPDLKRAFKKLGTPSVMKLTLEFPTGKHMAESTEEELRQAIIRAGAKTIATRAAKTLSEYLPNTIAVQTPYLISRQTWLINEALRINESLSEIDESIRTLLFGDPENGVEPHPYTEILFSFPVKSEGWACTLIGAIGDIDRFNTEKEFKKYLGVSAENRQSGTSVKGTHQTFSGVRDTRRVLFQMAIILITGNTKANVFQAYYERLLSRDMSKRKAIGHMCGKIAKVLYSCLKNGHLYDPEKHAAACGIRWDVKYREDLGLVDTETYYDEAAKLAGENLESTEDQD